MLCLAKQYEAELNQSIQDTFFVEENKWYHRQYSDVVVDLEKDTWNRMDFVSVYKDKVIGKLSATWKRPENYISNVSIINFYPEYKKVFALDLKRFLDYLVNNLKVYKINWMVVVGNPIEASYDKFCERYNGRVLGVYKKDTLINGILYDNKAYEWLREDYFKD